MTPTDIDVERLLAEIDEATQEIDRVKGSLRRRLVAQPESGDLGLTAALSYWEQRKQEAETQLRRFRR